MDWEENYFNAMCKGSGYVLGRKVGEHKGGKPSLLC